MAVDEGTTVFRREETRLLTAVNLRELRLASTVVLEDDRARLCGVVDAPKLGVVQPVIAPLYQHCVALTEGERLLSDARRVHGLALVWRTQRKVDCNTLVNVDALRRLASKEEKSALHDKR